MRWRLWAHQVQVAKLKKEVADRIEAERQLKSTQRALLNQERMRAMGEMAAGVAHDVNNALAPISAFSELISIDKESPDRIRKMAALALKSSRDAAEIIRRIQPLYWGEKTNTDNVAVHTLIAEVVSSVQALNNTPSVEPQKKISLIKDVVPAHFCCSPTELREVLTNLLTNAVGAIEEAGTIKVGCRVDEDQTVCIFVEDDGKGMNEATLKSCFSTFFSTKGRYGSGLGLSTSQAIITSYGGSISVKSEEGVGTRFDIRLPKLERAETPEESVPVEGDTTREHVLLVEDIESTQQAIASLITALGHDVTCVGSANEAIGALGQHHGFTIVLTDYGLPQQPGTELCRQVRTEHPMVCTILMTGNELPAMRELADGFLCKPVDLQALQKTIEQVCQKRETRARRVG
jgi:nitrogen-specific signal transduction histidine kinase/ActR/RegA family two-component response regulator